MASIAVNGISYSIGVDVILKDVSFSLEEGDKLGVVGVNGSGKSTLMKIISGELEPDSGDVFTSKDKVLGILHQDDTFNISNLTDESVLGQMYAAFPELLSAEAKIASLEAQIKSESDTEKLTRLVGELDSVNNRFLDGGGLYFRSKCKSMLNALGFDESFHALPITGMSGGQRTRIALARLLAREPDILLLDEPTNHLDDVTLEWLEEHLAAYKKTVIVVSHDRYFLDKVTNKTIELTGGKVFTYNGNFSSSRKEKQERIELEEKHFKNQMREIKRIEGIIEQQKRWNREKNIKTAESKQKQVERLKAELTVVEREDAKIDFNFSAADSSGKDVLTLTNVEFGYNSPLFSDVSLEIKKGDVIFLLGSNGCGKTTLFNLVNSTLIPQKGEIKKGSGVKIAKYDQNLKGLNPNKTIIDDVWDEFPRLTETEVRSALAAFLFRGDDVFKEIKTLSGGEKARVSLLKVILAKPNLLLLDEPTNHLDIASKDALETALSNFGGTMFIISHDRYFINSFATRICYMQEKRVLTYNGNYDYFLEKRLPQSNISVQAEKKVNDYKAEKELKGLKRSLENKIKKCEDDIAKLEDEISKLEEELALCGADYVRAMELSDSIGSKKTENEKLYEIWGELSDNLAQIES